MEGPGKPAGAPAKEERVGRSRGWQRRAARRGDTLSAVVAECLRRGLEAPELPADHPEAGGNLAHDLHTVALMKEHGVSEIRTANDDFDRFSGVRAVNPLEEGER